MKLENGILDFGAFCFTPKTTLAELTPHCPGAELTEAAGSSVLRCAKGLETGGERFLCEFYFFKGLPNLVLLRPLARCPDTVEGRMAQQAFRRDICDRWLVSQLGPPMTQTKAKTSYNFTWGNVIAVSHFDPRDAGDAGYLCLRYCR